MKYRYTCELNEKDIAQIIADRYNVDVKNVNLQAHMRLVGIGPAEGEEHFVTCKVELPANQMR